MLRSFDIDVDINSAININIGIEIDSSINIGNDVEIAILENTIWVFCGVLN